MTITYRLVKGSPLTFAEEDGNFADLAARTDTAWAMEGLEPTLRDGVGNPAELIDFKGGTFVLGFSSTVNQEAFLIWDVPLEWAAGTDVYAGVHWSPGVSSAAGNVRWGFEFTTAPVNGIFGDTAFFYVTASSTATAYRHIQSVSDPYPGSAVAPNQRFVIRFFRDATDGADTFPDVAYLLGLDFYYRVNKFGQPSITPPYI